MKSQNKLFISLLLGATLVATSCELLGLEDEEDDLTPFALLAAAGAGAGPGDSDNPEEVTGPLLVKYGNGEGPPGWISHLDTDEGATHVIVEVSDFGAQDGNRVLRFETTTGGFGDNKLEQCIAIIDENEDLTFEYFVYPSNVDDDDLRIRLNPNFYDNEEDCITDRNADQSDNRLSGGYNNEDLDIRFQTANLTANQWNHVVESTHGDIKGPMTIPQDQIPSGATHMLYSIRGRDVQNRAFYIDNIIVRNGTDNLDILNSSFEEVE